MAVKRFHARDKMEVLNLIRSGISKKSIARLLQIDKREITIWDLRYQQHGIRGLEPLRKRTISPAVKRQIVEEYLEGGISKREICAKHGISLSSLKNWLHQYNAAPQS